MAGHRNQQAQNKVRAETGKRKSRGRRRGGKRTIHYILLVLIVLVTGLILSLTVFFKIEEVRVLNLSRYSPDDIIADSGIVLGENLFRVSEPVVEERLLEKYPYIEKVEIKRKIPPAIELVITQAKPVGALAQGDDITLIAENGKVLERGTVFIPPQVPLIKGIPVGSVRAGEYLGEEAEEGLVMLRYLVSAMEEAEFHDITNVDFSDRLNIRIVYENRIILKLGTEADLAYKLTFVKDILDTKLEPNDEGIIDASNVNDNVVFRPADIHAVQEDEPAAEILPDDDEDDETGEKTGDIDDENGDETEKD